MEPRINDTSKNFDPVTAVLQGQDVVGVGQFALLCCGNSLSVTQRSVTVSVLKGRVVLSVTQPGEGKTQQRSH